MDESTIDWWSMSLGLFGGLSLFYGGMIMGLGLVFLGMTLMSQAVAPLRDYAPSSTSSVSSHGWSNGWCRTNRTVRTPCTRPGV